jgi:Family of unknown function (DUF6502)
VKALHREFDLERTADGKTVQINASKNGAVAYALIAQDQLLSGVVQFLSSVGLSKSNVSQRLHALADTVEAGRSVRTAQSAEYALYLSVCGVVHDWSRSPQYTDQDGEPKALPLRGRCGLSALIKRRLPREPISRILRCMQARRVVRQRADGRYVLVQRAVLVGKRDPVYLEWAAAVATEFLKTALENWKERDRDARQLDRVARVFNLPEDQASKFRAFAKKRAQSWLEEIDNWLEDHDAPKGRGRRVEAGVHVYGYVRAT